MSPNGSKTSENGVVGLIDGLFDRAVELGASDIHFEPTDRAVEVRLRVDGRLRLAETLPRDLLPNVVTRLKVLAGLLTYRVDIPQEGGLTLAGHDDLDVRIATFPTIRGERVAVRLLSGSRAVRGMDELGLSTGVVTSLIDAVGGRQGLILVTGPAGSGKTTTIFALLRHVQATMDGACIVTIEDPVEYRLDGVAQIQVAPHGELTYARALRSLLRQDPQVVLIGEIRGAETAQIVMEAALTGHLLFSTMHAGSAAEAIVRLREMGVPGYQLTSALRLVVAQRLVRTRCEACRESSGGDGDERCRTCLGTGFRGRTACAEAAAMCPELRSAILGGADASRIAETFRGRPGYHALAEDARRHIDAGRTTEDEVRSSVGSGVA